MTKYIRTLSTALLTCGLAFPAAADWTIDGDTSALHFLSTKNSQVTEVHKFDSFNGNLSDSGKLNVEVDLSSVNTAIDIRNKRMQEMLFNVSKYATAIFEATLTDSMMKLNAGDVVNGKVDGILTLHGQAVPTTFAVTVSQVDEDTLTVSTSAPTLIKAESFGLAKGVAALQEIAGLKSITTTVPVTFSVTLKR
ncbi:MAG: YceI family protein [Alteromonas sp.]|uniref:YceI family protein n=1 Tax=unclassified Alteromonas TaxID=2614992 RepID=UPI0009F889A9|nr:MULTISPECIES: YceI family protein [unclassified Alteromonas]AUC89978.1 YceI family protein [Alteromonas sp. MB-3u-76]MAI63431.1 YceI family protein [Alteromonas sp.]